MSGDVQPRKRKDKKKRKDDSDNKATPAFLTRQMSERDDDEIKEKISPSGVNASKMGPDDIQLHVHSDHGTGGHWCAKIFFFSLLAILLGLIGLILLENRGLSDLDTPLSESRYAEYLDGWVEENRNSHDDHDILESLHELDDHDHDNEPFQEDHDDDDDDDEKHGHDDDEHDDDDDDDDDDDASHLDHDNNNDDDDDDNDNDDDVKNEIDSNELNENDEDDQIANDVKSESIKIDDNDDIDEGFEEDDSSQQHDHHKDDSLFEEENDDDDDDDDDDNDDDDDDVIMEKVIDNDEGEELHLKKLAHDRAEEMKSTDENINDESSQIKRMDAENVEDEEIENKFRHAKKFVDDNPVNALMLFEQLLQKRPNASEILYEKAKLLDQMAEQHQSNDILRRAIEAYSTAIEFGDHWSDEVFKLIAERCIDRMRFIGQHLQAVPIHEALIKRFDNEPAYRNQLAVSYLLVNKLTEAKYILHNTLLRWRNDGFAAVHYGFVLKMLDKDMEQSVMFLRQGIESGADGTNDGRFYFNLGDALQRLGRKDEAMDVYQSAADKKLFLSANQRSMYNVNRLVSRPFWTKRETGYEHYFNILEQNWEKIRDEGLHVLNERGYFINEEENLRDSGDWKMFTLFARGKKMIKHCEMVPFTCKIIDTFLAARLCKRGQIKFSVIHPGTHVWPHCGPTNCRIRSHLGLQVPSDTFLRVVTETRSWQEGKILIFDDSFEHEVWHNGTGVRMVLIVDAWHPDLTDNERNNLSPI